MSALIEFDAVCKYYQMGDTTVKAADHITMKIEKGEFVAIVGQIRFGQIHLHEHHRLSGCAHPRHLPAQRPGRGQDDRRSWPLSATKCWALSSSNTICCPS